MKRHLIAITIPLALAALGCQKPNVDNYASFGAKFETTDAVPLRDAVARIDTHEGKPVCVKADIAEVCKKMGCWMMLADGNDRVRVRFTASEQCTDGFLLPRNCDGHTAYAKGSLHRESIPEDVARHYAEDQGKSEEEIARIVGPQPSVTMLATGVMISDAATLEPPVQ